MALREGLEPLPCRSPKHSERRSPRCAAQEHLELARSLGADHVIDYKKEDFTQNGQQYDLILAVNGYHPISDYLRALKPEGTYVVAGGSMRQLIQAGSSRRNASSKTGNQKISIHSLEQNSNDLILIKELLEAGEIKPLLMDVTRR